MAGEWIPIDCNLGTKPEVLELVDETDTPVEVVVYRLIQLWSWASMNTADGVVKATPRRLSAVAGGDDRFWLAVEQVGWIRFDGPHLEICGWEKRFSKAAKARSLKNRRQSQWRESKEDSVDACVDGGVDACEAQARLQERLPEEKRGEEKREEELQPAAPVSTSKPPRRQSSSKNAVISWTLESGWHGITDADRAGWQTAYPGADLDREFAKATEWLKANPKRAGKRNWRKFLVGWLQRCQDRGGTQREQGNRPQEQRRPERWLDQYQPAQYRRPKEVATVAASIKLHEDDL